jgi:cysteinyl-tRNA synthetase
MSTPPVSAPPAASIRLYDTLTRHVQAVVPREPGVLRVYVCGMTVYDHCHVGHARAMIVYDTLVRYLRYRGWKVIFVRNFTDIDDKILARAASEGVGPMDIADRYIASFHEDARALGLAPPDHEPRVSHTLPEIIGMISALLDKGHAYLADGTVWFDVRSFPKYGALSGQRVDDLRNDDPEGGKHAAADFALWKSARPGEAAWESPWGPGRPGWHIECSAMAYATLGPQVDIHGGGLDLVFPHHENEIAQSECSHGHHPFVRTWMHNGMITVGTGTKAGGRAHREAEAGDSGEAIADDRAQVGEKMGKSKNNAFVIKNALQTVPAPAIRMYYLQNHYRSPLPWSDEALIEALSMLVRLVDARDQAMSMEGDEDPAVVVRDLGEDARAAWEAGINFERRLYEALDDDFNTARALGVAFEVARTVNRFAGHKKAKKRGGPVVAPALLGFAVLQHALGALPEPGSPFHEEVRTKRLRAMGIELAEVEGRIAARQQARAERDWARADQLRAELTDLGIEVMDAADSVTWRVKLT